MKKKQIFIIVVITSLMITITSCSPKGWGCNGRGKIMTRVR